MNQLEQAEFQVKALFLAVVQIIEGAQGYLQIAGQLFLGKQQRGSLGAGAFVG